MQQHGRTVGSSENPRGLNLTSLLLIGIGLNFLPKSGKGEITNASLVPTVLYGNVFTILCVQLFYSELYRDKLKVCLVLFQVTLSRIVSLFQTLLSVNLWNFSKKYCYLFLLKWSIRDKINFKTL